MAVYSGRQVAIAMAVEDPAGVLKAPSHRLILDQKAFKRMIEKQVNTHSAGVRSSQFSQHIFREHSGGPLSGYLDADIMGLVGVALFGKKPVSAGAPPSRTHTWSGANEDSVLVAPFSIYRKTPNYQDAFRTCRPSKAMLKFMENSYTEYELDFMGFAGASNATALPAVPSATELAYFVPKNVELKIADSAGNIGAASPLRAKTVTINYDAKVVGYPTIGQTDYAEIGSMEYSLNIDIVTLIDTDTLRQIWINDNVRYVQITIRGDKQLTASGSSAVPTFVIKIPAAQIKTWAESEPNSDFSEQTLTLSGFYNAGISSTMSAILTNATASY